MLSFRRYEVREEIIDILNTEILFIIIFLVLAHTKDPSLLGFLISTLQSRN